LKVSGALALLGADQYEIGRQTGRMVAKILRSDAQTANLKIEYPTRVSVEVNDDVAKMLGITIPESLKMVGEN
jgi:putative ABC transport system substrate-binding protein